MMQATDESPRMFESDFVDFFTCALVYGARDFRADNTWLGLHVLQPRVGMGRDGGLGSVDLHGGRSPSTSFIVRYFIGSPRLLGPKFHFMLHGVHHDWYNDRLRLVMPPAAALFSAIFLSSYYGIGWALSAG